MPFTFNPFTGKFDVIMDGIPRSGGVMTGPLTITQLRTTDPVDVYLDGSNSIDPLGNAIVRVRLGTPANLDMITGGVPGQLLTVMTDDSQILTIRHATGSTPANQIYSLNLSGRRAYGQQGSVWHFKYTPILIGGTYQYRWMMLPDNSASPVTKCVFAVGTGSVVWTNMPAAKTQLFGEGNNQFWFDQAAATQFRILVNVVTASTSGTALLRLQSSDGVAPMADLGGGDCPINATGIIAGPWGLLTQFWSSSGISDVRFRLVGLNGGGVGDVPAFRALNIEFR